MIKEHLTWKWLVEAGNGLSKSQVAARVKLHLERRPHQQCCYFLQTWLVWESPRWHISGCNTGGALRAFTRGGKPTLSVGCTNPWPEASGRRERQNWALKSMALAFLAADTVWLAASRSGSHAFSKAMHCEPKLTLLKLLLQVFWHSNEKSIWCGRVNTLFIKFRNDAVCSSLWYCHHRNRR